MVCQIDEFGELRRERLLCEGFLVGYLSGRGGEVGPGMEGAFGVGHYLGFVGVVLVRKR